MSAPPHSDSTQGSDGFGENSVTLYTTVTLIQCIYLMNYSVENYLHKCNTTYFCSYKLLKQVYSNWYIR